MVYQNLNKTEKNTTQRRLNHLLVEIASADPEGGSGGPDPSGKSQVIWVSLGYKQLDPLEKVETTPPPLENVGPPLEP